MPGTYHKAVRAIILNGDTLLAMRRHKYGDLYYALIGGWVEPGEEHEAALKRELHEETGLEVGSCRLVFIEDAGELYGEQYIYLCEYLGGDPVLNPASDEVALSASGDNTYEPLWLPIDDVSKVKFRSSSVRDAVLEGIQNGFPETPQTLAWRG